MLLASEASRAMHKTPQLNTLLSHVTNTYSANITQTASVCVQFRIFNSTEANISEHFNTSEEFS